MELTEQQKEAIEYFESPLLIVAGPGTGKTKVLTEKVIQLIEKKGFDPNRILVSTFTTKAADELKDRLRKRLGDKVETMQISTIHSFCQTMLEEFSEDKINNIIISLEKLNSLYWIAGYTSQKVRDPQLTLILMIRKGENFNRLERFMKKKEIEQDVYSRVKKNLETNSYSPRWGKYVLARYELEIDDSSYIKYIDLNDSQIQIEHIMPQTKSKGWVHIPENDYEQHVNNIGNLTLLSGGKEGKNQKIGNWSFEKKKEIYIGMNQSDDESNLYKKVAFRMIDDIIINDSWDLNIIKNRSENIISTLLKAWNVKKINYNFNDLKSEFGSIENLRDELEEFVSYRDSDYRNKFLYFLECLLNSEKGISRDVLKKKINDKFGEDKHFVNSISNRLTGNEKIDLVESIGFEKEGRVKDNYFIKEEQKNNIKELLEIENEK